MKVTRILHASVNTATDREASRRFYEELLGLAPEWRPEVPGVPGEWFGVGGVQVHLVGRPESGQALDPSRHHVCYGVADLAEAVAELDAKGIRYVRGEQDHHGVRVEQVFVTDPAGNVVELQQDRG